MKIASGTAMLALALLATSSAAQSEEQATNDKVDQDNRIVCKTVAETGSRLGRRRTCLTQSQWADKYRADKDAARDATTRQSNPTVDGANAAVVKPCPRC